ncbi:pectin lyase fold/virulence factor [Xylariales sp. PMI_506]|nr:pectin lyase fold/virulence factor [Xylariales sp. PMI_506]
MSAVDHNCNDHIDDVQNIDCNYLNHVGATDDTPAIASAIAACPSGTIVIPKGTTYNIGSQLLFTGCSGCTMQLDGTLKVSVDFTYWNGKGKVIYINKINGATITSPAGTGVIDGQGQASWDYIVTTAGASYSRPYLMRVDGSTNFRMTGITLKNAPSFHVVTSGSSSNVYYGDITLYSVSTSANVAHNTDGFDIGPASYVTVENVHITNDDDCVVLKPGADNVLAQDITCVGSHGLSVGSLGSTAGNDDTVTNSIFRRAVMTGSTKASGIKVYPGGSAHGTSTVTNVTWQDIECDGCQYAIQIQTCYEEDADYCAEYPSTATFTNVVWKNITGTTDGSEKDSSGKQVVGNIDCSSAGTCGITISELTAKTPTGSTEVLCANTPSNIGITCTSGASG